MGTKRLSLKVSAKEDSICLLSDEFGIAAPFRDLSPHLPLSGPLPKECASMSVCCWEVEIPCGCWQHPWDFSTVLAAPDEEP